MTFSAYESQDHDLSSYLCSIMLDGVKENQDQSFKCPKSLAEMMNNVDFMDSIKVSVNIKKGELFLMILKFCITNSLSVTAMTNLFKLINIIFDSPILPDCRYSLDKLLNPKEHAEFHAVCHNCTAYVGKFGEISSVKNCKICEAELDLDNPSSTSFFVLLDPSTQIQNLLNLYEDHYEYVVNERISKPDRIEDVYGGQEYRKFVKTLPPEEKHSYVSAVFNTDGTPKFECSQYSIWPLYLMLNELPKQQRMQKLITCGLWFNKKKQT
ncbi:uncharacterized protein LOC116415821 [Nasonia vitripennis]|uniref:Uncharacterized protein n=1 Tax=Nasonia vitripennis TaxID=7425 RepID=A0A7M7PWD9_NASVI|nr:uncharacterized protein LOC116415821 [Nasonia vitripennis]